MRESICQCVQRHVPLPSRQYIINVEDEIVYVCPTTFFNVQDLIAEYQIYGEIPPGSVTKHFSKFVRDLCLALYRENKYNE